MNVPAFLTFRQDNGLKNVQLALDTAESEFDIPAVLDASDMANETPNELVNMTYLSYFRDKVTILVFRFCAFSLKESFRFRCFALLPEFSFQSLRGLLFNLFSVQGVGKRFRGRNSRSQSPQVPSQETHHFPIKDTQRT
jgi:hypothetical protein